MRVDIPARLGLLAAADTAAEELAVEAAVDPALVAEVVVTAFEAGEAEAS